MDKSAQKTALFSLSDQTDVLVFARELTSMGWRLLATRETATLLAKEGIPVIDYADFVNIKEKYPFPPTLHPKTELALTKAKGETIELVYINTYSLDKGNDVGGHTILGLAAKGKRITVSEVMDMRRVIEALKTNSGVLPLNMRQELLHKANLKIANHYLSLTNDFASQKEGKVIPLLEGENPYQVPAHLIHYGGSDPLAIGNFKKVSGIAPCFTNLADFDNVLKIICALHRAFKKHYGKAPYITVAAKHGNPCGLAVDWHEPQLAMEKALWGNAKAIWGGEVMVNFPLNDQLAEGLTSSERREKILGSRKWMLDVVAAPAISKKGIAILGSRQRTKIFISRALNDPYMAENNWEYRLVRGGLLKQPPHNYILNLKECKTYFPEPKEDVLDSLLIAWGATWFSSHGGNEISLAANRKLLSTGGGPATTDAANHTVLKAKTLGHEIKGAVFAADAFFPFTDGPKLLVDAGCAYGLVPAGGIKFQEVADFFKKNKIWVYFLPERYRGFCRH